MPYDMEHGISTVVEKLSTPGQMAVLALGQAFLEVLSSQTITSEAVGEALAALIMTAPPEIRNAYEDAIIRLTPVRSS